MSFSFMSIYIPKSTLYCSLVFLFLYCTFPATEAYEPLHSTGNITIKWDIMAWTPDGYVAVVTIFNFQKYPVQAPGWRLGWTWAKMEVIWTIIGAQTTEQGDCSKFEGNIPTSCRKNPTVVDLPRRTPYQMQVANCCKDGVLSSWFQDPANAISSFQISVGAAGTTNRTVKIPKNFTLEAPGPGYTCSSAKVVRPTHFITHDGKRVTQALLTWSLNCACSQWPSRSTPTCHSTTTERSSNAYVSKPEAQNHAPAPESAPAPTSDNTSIN